MAVEQQLRDLVRASGGIYSLSGSCQFNHLAHLLSGRMQVTTDDGSEAEIGRGDMLSIQAGHAEVIGDEPCVSIDIAEEDAEYARGRWFKPAAPMP